MTQNFDKTWLQSSFNQNAIKRAQREIQATGRALPCVVTAVSGSIVTVSFEVDGAPAVLPPVTIPKAESQWVRAPTQKGDKGVTMPADAYLGGVSGLGGGTATLTQRGNLTPLVWLPVASTGFPAVNTDATYIAGPQGAVIQTEDGSAVLTVATSGITMTFGSKTVVLNGSGFTIDGILFDTHTHSDPQGGNTGGPQ